MSFIKLRKHEIKELVSYIDILYDENNDLFENFKQIKFNGESSPYLISSFGRVFSINYKHKIRNITQLKTTIDKDGYELLVINYNGKSNGFHIHRMVAKYFIKNKNKSKYTQVNHIDCDKLNNRSYNLEWTTPKENIEHAWKNNLSKSKGEGNGRNVYSEKSIKKVCKMIENNRSFNDINEKTGVSIAMISLIYRKKNWTHISDLYDFESYNYGK